MTQFRTMSSPDEVAFEHFSNSILSGLVNYVNEGLEEDDNRELQGLQIQLKNALNEALKNAQNFEASYPSSRFIQEVGIVKSILQDWLNQINNSPEDMQKVFNREIMDSLMNI